MGVMNLVKVNGAMLDVDGKTVAEVIELENYKPERVAVELNLEILPKADYAATVLKDGDTVEIVSFVGGG